MYAETHKRHPFITLKKIKMFSVGERKKLNRKEFYEFYSRMLMKSSLIALYGLTNGKFGLPLADFLALDTNYFPPVFFAHP